MGVRVPPFAPNALLADLRQRSSTQSRDTALVSNGQGNAIPASGRSFSDRRDSVPVTLSNSFSIIS